MLRASGVQAGDRVALLAGTRAECVALFHGCLRVGAVLVPLNWRLSAPELARVLADARPSVLVCEPRHDALAARALAAEVVAPGIATLRLDAADGAPDAPMVAPFVGDAESATMLLYTSGSTGAPKGVVLPRRQLLYNAVATVTGWRMTPDDVVPVSTPLFHTGGWHVFLTPVLHVGGTVVLFDGFEPARFLSGLAEHACTLAFAVPTQFTMLTAEARWGARMPALRRFVSGGHGDPRGRLRLSRGVRPHSVRPYPS